jgi:hypothetical protein
MNRPLVLVESLENDTQPQKDNLVEHLFRLEFDTSCGIAPTWVDTKTLNFFNKLRDNIFASSGQYDTVYAVNVEKPPVPKEEIKKPPRFSSIEA